MSKIFFYWKDESGAAAAEYALILAIIGITIATAVIFLGGDFDKVLNAAATAIVSGSF